MSVVTNSGQTQRAGAQARPGKRERLIAAARDAMYRRGVAGTTLADIAQAADVPLGNVYYYFKTKDDILAAVAQSHVENIQETFALLERRHRSAKGRLKGLVRVLADRADETSQYGCPFGTWSAELAKRTDGPGPLSAPLMRLLLDWAEQQFQALERPDARDLAVELVSAYEGSALLSNVLGQPDVMFQQARRLEKRIEEL